MVQQAHGSLGVKWLQESPETSMCMPLPPLSHISILEVTRSKSEWSPGRWQLPAEAHITPEHHHYNIVFFWYCVRSFAASRPLSPARRRLVTSVIFEMHRCCWNNMRATWPTFTVLWPKPSRSHKNYYNKLQHYRMTSLETHSGIMCNFNFIHTDSIMSHGLSTLPFPMVTVWRLGWFLKP